IDNNNNDGDVEHQLCQQQKNALIDIIKQRYANRTEHSASVSTTPTMPRAQSPSRRPSSTGPYDDEIYTTKMTTATAGFTRGYRTRTSLPVIVRPASTKVSSLGLCFLCVGDEIKKVLLPNEVTCTDTVKALFVRKSISVIGKLNSRKKHLKLAREKRAANLRDVRGSESGTMTDNEEFQMNVDTDYNENELTR
ncbi:unnamed protein product, partial [Didymodactylos carnosus]